MLEGSAAEAVACKLTRHQKKGLSGATCSSKKGLLEATFSTEPETEKVDSNKLDETKQNRNVENVELDYSIASHIF